MKLTSYCGGCIGDDGGCGGGGTGTLLVQKSLRYKDDGSYDYSCSEY